MTLPEFPERASSQAHSAAARPAPPKYSPLLVPKLRTVQQSLNTRLAGLVVALDRQPASQGRELDECVRQFGAVREAETAWLYPLLANAVATDAGARGQLAELRLIGLILARRVLRSFDDLQQAARAEVLAAEAASRVAAALASYLRHCENAIYPLYELAGSEHKAAAAVG